MKKYELYLFEKGILKKEDKFKILVSDVTDVVLTDWEKHKRGNKPSVTYKIGEYFTKISVNNRAYLFVDNETGVIHRPANDKVPRKISNLGNIQNKNVYHDKLTPHGLTKH